MPFGLSMLIVFSKVIKVVHLAGMMDKKKTNGVPFSVPFGVPFGVPLVCQFSIVSIPLIFTVCLGIEVI